MLLALNHARHHLVCSSPDLFLPFDLIVLLEKDHLAQCYLSSPYIRQDSGTNLVRTHTLSIPYTTTCFNIWVIFTRILIFPLVLVSFSRRRYMSYS